MKWSMATIGVIILGLIGVAVIFLFQNLTTSSENDYYLLKEITEAAMFDSIDLTYYRETGHVKIVREKFVENFTRRYAESTLFVGERYIISFYNIMEEPPKVSLLINTSIEDYQIYGEETRSNYNVYNSLTGIFEYVGKNINSEEVYSSKGEFAKTYYSMPKVSSDGTVSVYEPFNMPNEMAQKELKRSSIKITFSKPSVSNVLGDILKAKLYREIDWVRAVNEEEYRTNYTEAIAVDEYANDCDITRVCYYDCYHGNGDCSSSEISNMLCSKYKTFWMHIEGNCKDKTNALIIIPTKFEYEEYKY